MNFSQIETKAHDVHREIWAKRAEFWPEGLPHPIHMLDPAVAARALHVNFEYHEELGRFGAGNDRFEIAGLINRQTCNILVSRKFPLETMRFTGAHEVGHWLLHPGEVMHRDRPIKGIISDRLPRSVAEREADYFAACFLIPRKLAIEAFEARFTKAPLALDDASAFWLSQNDADSLLQADVESLDFALAVASARSYAGRHFDCLAKQFDVSPTTMAIRLRELNLIQA